MAAPHYFSQGYAEARRKFVSVAETAGAQLGSFVNPIGQGPEGEELATDVARFGAADAEAVLMVNSGTHGVEGFCGSGSQIGLLAQGVHKKLPRGVAMVLSHALNPHGFAHWRRVNEDNVDLNRNFGDHAAGHAANAPYAEIHDWLLPADWDGPARKEAEAKLAEYAATRGMKALQSALSTGQHQFADGLFYGGVAPVWSNRTWNEIVRRHAGRAKKVVFIDLHTGLGPEGYGEPIWLGETAAEFNEAKQAFGSDLTWLAGGGSSSAIVQGSIEHGFRRNLAPGTRQHAFAIEYGTLPLPEMMLALRADHWLYKTTPPAMPFGNRTKKAIRDAFYVDTDDWKEKIVARCTEKVEKALAWLA